MRGRGDFVAGPLSGIEVGRLNRRDVHQLPVWTALFSAHAGVPCLQAQWLAPLRVFKVRE